MGLISSMMNLGSSKNTAIDDKIFWHFTRFPCNFDLVQAKWKMEFEIIFFVYGWPRELLNRLRLMLLGKLKIKRKSGEKIGKCPVSFFEINLWQRRSLIT